MLEIVFTISGRPGRGPLVCWIVVGLVVFVFPEATRASSFRWPSTNSVVRFWVIDKEELMVSCAHRTAEVTTKE